MSNNDKNSYNSLDLENFFVVSIEATTWKGKRELFHAETCARHMLVLEKSQLGELPKDVMEKCELRTGIKGYEHLLRFACGLLSGHKGEYHVSEQLRDTWRKFREKNPFSRPKGLDRYIDDVIANSRLVREITTGPGFQATSTYLAAKSLAGIEDGDTALIICNDKKSYTYKLALALGKFNSTSATKILVTHPDQEVSDEIFTLLQEAKRKKFIKSEIQQVDFTTGLPQAMLEAKSVFVGLPIGQIAGADEKILEAWANRKPERGNFIVRMSGEPAVDYNADWLAAENLITPSRVMDRFTERAKKNAVTLESAEEACQIVCRAREQGINSGRGMQRLLDDCIGGDEKTIEEALKRLTEVQRKYFVRAPGTLGESFLQ